MDYTYKQLTPQDVPLLKDLLKLFGEVFDDMTSYQSAVPSDAYLQSLLSKPHFFALVAMNGDEMVGGLAAYALDKFEQERSEVYIYDLAVVDAHRRKGIATGLINTLKPIAKDYGAYIIFVQADHGDDPAIKLYESLGVREDVYHFDIPVE